MWGLSSSQTQFPWDSQRSTRLQEKHCYFLQHENSSNLFYKLLYASHPPLRTPPATSSQLKPLQRAPRIAVWSRVHAAVWLHIPAFHFASVLLRGSGYSRAAPRRQLLLRLEKPRQGSTKSMHAPSSKLQNAAIGSWDATSCTLVSGCLAKKSPTREEAAFLGHPWTGSTIGDRARSLPRCPGTEPSSPAKCPLTLEMLLVQV